ncbi:MAG TPA: arginase family protein [Gaiellaceae bacterium]|nr:arginase family protein [Gaiellaceae bacterium]
MRAWEVTIDDLQIDARTRSASRPGPQVAVIEVPSALGLHPNGVQDAPDAFREVGLHRLLEPVEVVRVDVPASSPAPETKTSMLNAEAIAVLALRVADRVQAAIEDGRFPLVLGGDCSIVLGPLLALRRHGRYGLAFIDCHADFCHPYDEPTGEVASLDLALATGRGPTVLSDLEARRPLIRDEDVALIGYRAFGDNDHYLSEHVRDTAITIVDLYQLRELGIRKALRSVIAELGKPELDGFWVHLDVDVLDDTLMPAVDHHHSGGLTWKEAATVLRSILQIPTVAGLDVTIFNPRLDPDGTLANRLAALIAGGVASTRYVL